MAHSPLAYPDLPSLLAKTLHAQARPCDTRAPLRLLATVSGSRMVCRYTMATASLSNACQLHAIMPA